MTVTWSSIIKLNTKLNASLAVRQRADLFKANISAYKIGVPQCQGYAEMVFTQLNTGPHKVKKGPSYWLPCIKWTCGRA